MVTYDDFCKGWNKNLLGNADARNVFDFLCQPKNIYKMIVMSEFGLPALGGVVKPLESKFANATGFPLSKDKNRMDVGAMVKRILGEFGYETFEDKSRPLCDFMEAKLVKTAHVYAKTGKPTANLVISIV